VVNTVSADGKVLTSMLGPHLSGDTIGGMPVVLVQQTAAKLTSVDVEQLANTSFGNRQAITAQRQVKGSELHELALKEQAVRQHWLGLFTRWSTEEPTLKYAALTGDFASAIEEVRKLRTQLHNPEFNGGRPDYDSIAWKQEELARLRLLSRQRDCLKAASEAMAIARQARLIPANSPKDLKAAKRDVDTIRNNGVQVTDTGEPGSSIQQRHDFLLKRNPWRFTSRDVIKTSELNALLSRAEVCLQTKDQLDEGFAILAKGIEEFLWPPDRLVELLHSPFVSEEARNDPRWKLQFGRVGLLPLDRSLQDVAVEAGKAMRIRRA
jgi:hypothetical protein